MMMDLKDMITETRNENTMNLDEMTPSEIIRVMNREDEKTVSAVRQAFPQIEQTILWTTEALKQGGRIVYLGAGTSGRLGVLDAAECQPTFGVPDGMVIGLIAGGPERSCFKRSALEYTQRCRQLRQGERNSMGDTYRLGIDGGGTATEFCAEDPDGSVLLMGRAGAININGQSPKRAGQVFTEVQERLREKDLAPDRCLRIGVGAAGISNPSSRMIFQSGLKEAGFTCPVSFFGDQETGVL